MFVEDWWKGFRQIFPTVEDMAVAIVAIQDPDTGEWLYTQLRGLPFGLGTAVNQFGRMAALQTAVARRILYLLLGHYADDTAAVDEEQRAGEAQERLNELAGILGVLLSEKKRKSPASMRDFLGHAHDLSRIRTDAQMTFGPKMGMRERIQQEVQACRAARSLTSGNASKLRGALTWLDTGLDGRVCRGALSALVARQYYDRDDSVEPGSNLDLSLGFLESAVTHQVVRAVPVTLKVRKPVLVYTDASAEATGVRIGAMVVVPGQPTEVLVYDPPQEVVDRWGDGDTIINQAELHAAPVVACTMPDALRDADVVWFIDNTAAEAALVKAGSPTQTMCALALVATAALASLRVRPWFEHVPSPDNPADALSRGGYSDPKVAEEIRAGRYVASEPVAPPMDAILDYDFWWRRATDVVTEAEVEGPIVPRDKSPPPEEAWGRAVGSRHAKN